MKTLIALGIVLSAGLAGCSRGDAYVRRVELKEDRPAKRVVAVEFTQTGFKRLFLPGYDWQDRTNVRLRLEDGSVIYVMPGQALFRNYPTGPNPLRESPTQLIGPPAGADLVERCGPFVKDEIVWPSSGGLFAPNELKRSKAHPGQPVSAGAQVPSAQ